MNFFKTIAYGVLILYGLIGLLLYLLQTRLLFYPGKLPENFKFKSTGNNEEVSLATTDRETINGLFFHGHRPEVILYFHGNAGDLSGWQFIAEDFLPYGYNLLIIDYRGYGKSTGAVSEEGLYRDADAALRFLVEEKDFAAPEILIYGRSIGTGVAIDLASRVRCRGLILESAHASLKKMANEKFPFFFPSLYLKYHFNNLEKIKHVQCPVLLIHGSEDTLIPATHSDLLLEQATTQKKLVIIRGGEHNNLNAFEAYHKTLKDIPAFFDLQPQQEKSLP